MIWGLIGHCLIIIEWLGEKRVRYFCVNFVEMLSCILFDKVSFVLDILRMQKKKHSPIFCCRDEEDEARVAFLHSRTWWFNIRCSCRLHMLYTSHLEDLNHYVVLIVQWKKNPTQYSGPEKMDKNRDSVFLFLPYHWKAWQFKVKAAFYLTFRNFPSVN